MNLVEETKGWLGRNHITVPDDWLQACVEWIQEENQGRSLSTDELNSLVYEQWLLSDLHELEVQCLPSDIRSASKYELTGTYALQVDSILDVGLSFYSQQQKLKGTENANAKVSAEEPTYKPWEQKPSRMLMLKLTDGKQVIQGMEYKQITCLSPQTLPGTKVLVHGSILCRYGVLMLSEANIKNLGGEVDTLVEANTMLNTLQSAMEASAELARKNHRQEFSGSEIRNNKGNIKQCQVSATQGRTFGQSQRSIRPSVNNQPKMKQEPQSQNHGSGSTAQQGNIINNNQQINAQGGRVFNDDFIDDIDFDDDFEESCIQTYNRARGSGAPLQQKGTSRSTNNQRTNSHTNRSLSQKTTVQSIQGKNVLKSKGDNLQAATGVHRGESDYRSSQVNTSNTSLDDFEFEDDDDFDIQAVEMAEKRQPDIIHHSTSKNEASFGQTVKKSKRNFVMVPDSRYDEDNTSLVTTEESTDQRHNTSSDIKQSSYNDRPTPHASDTPVKIETSDLTRNTVKRGASITSKQNSITDHLLPNKIQKIKTEQKKILKEQTKLDVESEYPYTYLSKVMDSQIEETPTYHTVKAYISTLTGKLSSQNNKWTLSCKINDGTQAVDVDLSTQVLTEMIGFSPQEAQEMKKRVSREPEIKEVLKEGLQQCQQKLIELMCLMEIEMSTRNPRPVIVATRQLTNHNAEMLCNRVMSNWDKL